MTFTSPDSPVQIGEVILDKYRVERFIGQGGMGVVVAARHLELEQSVAIKFLLPDGMGVAGAIERFVREARAAARLRSQHVTTIYDVGRLPTGAPYLVMELLDGTDLSSLLRSTGRLRVGDAVEFVIQASEAVAEAHGAGIVHRDLKPANLFLTRRVNGTPLIKVLDFGISKVSDPYATDASLTKTSDVVGSPYYMAPEQVRSAKDVDQRTDIWAMGVILYELIAGQVPFVAENVPQLCAKLLETEPTPITAIRPDVPQALWAVIQRCLAKNPEHRYASVSELVHDLAPFASVGTGATPAGVNAPTLGGGFGIRSSVTLGETFQNSEPPGENVRSSMTLGQTQHSNAGPMRNLALSPHASASPSAGSLQGSALRAGASSESSPAGSTHRGMRVLAFATAAAALGVVILGTGAVVWMQRSRKPNSYVVVAPAPNPVVGGADPSAVVAPDAAPPATASASATATASAEVVPPSITTSVATGHKTPPSTPTTTGTGKSTTTAVPTRPPEDFLPNDRK